MMVKGSVESRPVRRLCVFCGSHNGSDPTFKNAAAELGVGLARRGVGVVYGGGDRGIMGALALATMDAGGQVIGVVPKVFDTPEFAQPKLTEIIRVDSMHERKATMFSLSDGFVAMPGGVGTMEELFEIVTWSQIGLHDRPIALLNLSGYFDGLRDWLAQAQERGFIPPQTLDSLIWEAHPGQLVSRLLGDEAARASA